MASTKLQRTFTTDHGNVYKWTYSFWVKRSKISSGDHAITAVTYSGAYQSRISFKSDDKLEIYDYRNNSYILQKKTNRKFRDTSAWYHIVVSNDNTQASADDRTKIYINGVQETSFGTNTQYSQNQKTSFNDDYPNYIGSYGSGDYFDGSMSHFHFIDGTAYAPTEFGETDSTTGEWKIKTNVSVTYGTNGFFILKDGNSVTDQSGNSNNFTVGGGTLTKTEDNPSNVFATINALDNYRFNGTFSNGNNTVASNASVESYWTSSLGASSGKYYWEVKVSASGSDKEFIGIADKVAEATDFSPYSGNNKMRSYYGSTGVSVIGSTGTAFGATFGAGDIIGVAMDLDNHKIYYSKNGVFQGSGNPSTGANGLDIDTSPASGFYYAQGANIHNTASTFQTNFGNGYFGTTAVSSAGTNASNNGIFEYDVPSGYTALSTKGLNT